jgi:hypothetical protein
MGKSDNILKFEEALRNDPEKQKAFEEALEKIAEEKSVESESEAFVKAAKELGFDTGTVPAASPWWLLPTFYVRELYGLLYQIFL